MNMINKTFVGVIVGMAMSFCAISVSAQQQAKTLFVNMPDSLLPLLTAVNRADCIDFLESNMQAKVENRFGKTSEMTALTKDYINLQITPSSTWQMKMLPVNDSTQVICVVSTVCAPVCDSDIRFYDTQWNVLPISQFMPGKPLVSDFFSVPTDSASYAVFKEEIDPVDMLLTKAQLSGAGDELNLVFTTPEYIEKETAEKLEPFLRRQISYDWIAGKYLPVQTTVDK